MNVITKKIELADGRVIEIETGKLAKQADGSAVVKMGGTMILATVCAAKEVKEGTDFMPLTVDYREKYFAAGRYPGGFMKRESKPSALFRRPLFLRRDPVAEEIGGIASSVGRHEPFHARSSPFFVRGARAPRSPLYYMRAERTRCAFLSRAERVAIAGGF